MLAVAGGRKTQGVVDHCVAAPAGNRILVLTYTLANQDELTERLAKHRPLAASVEVRGWFSFLLKEWVRPYLPRLFPQRVLCGLNFEGDAGRYVTGEARYLDKDGRAYKRHLAHLACEVLRASDGAVLDRLSRIYDHIWIDEVQDLNGWDLVALEFLMDSPIELELVGDVRQAILDTNVQDQKYSQFKGVAIKRWIDAQVHKGRLVLEHRSTTWRCNAHIAAFADSIFDAEWGFAPTSSLNASTTGHDGVFAVAMEHADAYCSEFEPLCLRWNAASGRDLDLPFMNIGVAKGLEHERVLILLTNTMQAFLASGKPLAEKSACSLYVAATRARSSVALVAERPDRLGLPIWKPADTD
jgi:DNA helicase II / ATP-dependent DNA helicase PcrA